MNLIDLFELAEQKSFKKEFENYLNLMSEKNQNRGRWIDNRFNKVNFFKWYYHEFGSKLHKFGDDGYMLFNKQTACSHSLSDTYEIEYLEVIFSFGGIGKYICEIEFESYDTDHKDFKIINMLLLDFTLSNNNQDEKKRKNKI